MKTLYLDIFSGLSGDMFIGALLDLGVSLRQLEHELEKLGLKEYHLHAARQQRRHIQGTKFDVHLVHLVHVDEAPGSPGGGQGCGHEGHDHGHDHGHGHDALNPVPASAARETARAQAPAHSHPHSHSHSHSHGEPCSHDHDHDHGHEHEHEQMGERTFGEIRGLIERSGLSEWVKRRAVGVFQRIAVAEGKIHGHPPEEVHFHEVGAVDSIVDVVGACIGLELLGCPAVISSPVVEGRGWVHCAHGSFPLPAPATLEILAARGVTVSQCEEPQELVTPTGAALLAEFAESFAPMRGLKPTRIGYGLGTRENKTRPNVVRAILAEGVPEGDGALDWETDTVAVLETNVDDASAELMGSLVEQLLTQGALDVFHTPVQMKKNRPGVLLTVVCLEADADRFSESLLRESTAFGVRRHLTERRKLRRELVTVDTSFGPVTVKLGLLNGEVVQASPEFESCRVVAERARVPLKRVFEAASRALPASGPPGNTTIP